MANQNPVQVVEKNPGPKIPWRQNGTKLIFGPDDDLTINCASRERDYDVHADICADDDGNLVIGVGTGKFYVGQIDIPARSYIEVEPEPEPEPNQEVTEGMADAMEGMTGADTEPERREIRREPVPIDMGKVTLTLWSLTGMRNSE